MKVTHRPNRILAAALLAGGVAVAGMATAQAAPGGRLAEGDTVAPPDPDVGGEDGPTDSPAPPGRRSASGSAMQQLRSNSGG